MKELVFRSEKGNTVTTSLLVAEKFGKEHRHVLDTIDELVKGVAENSADLFYETTYIHSQNKQEYRMYLMNRDGFSLLVMGFTGKQALQFKLDFISAFNKMEQAVKQLDFSNPQTVLILAQNWADEQTKRLQAEKIIEDQKPKVLFTDAVVGSKSSCLIGELAKIISQNGYAIGQNRLFAWLRENGYLGTRGENRNIPNQQYIEMGLFELKKGTRSGSDGVMFTTITPKVTGKGQVYFVNKFLNNNPKALMS